MYSKIIVTPKYFPAQWCDNVNNFMLKNVAPDPQFGKKGVRRCTVRLLAPAMKPYEGVFDSMMSHAKQIMHHLDVDVDYKIDGAIQHITYNPGDHVGWHNDTMNISAAMNNPLYSNLKTNRKVSMTVMLSDPSEYTGGEFIFEPGIKVPHKVEGKGTTAMFTSHSQHKVEEITSVVRNILFIFMTGPEWR